MRVQQCCQVGRENLEKMKTQHAMVLFYCFRVIWIENIDDGIPPSPKKSKMENADGKKRGLFLFRAMMNNNDDVVVQTRTVATRGKKVNAKRGAAIIINGSSMHYFEYTFLMLLLVTPPDSSSNSSSPSSSSHAELSQRNAIVKKNTAHNMTTMGKESMFSLFFSDNDVRYQGCCHVDRKNGATSNDTEANRGYNLQFKQCTAITLTP